MPFGWVAADEAYGQNGPLRDWLEERHVSYVVAVPKSFPVATAAGLVRADHLAALVPAAGWQQVSCGDGSKGPRYYDWALITTTSPDRHLLVRRSLTPDAMGKRELAFFTCHAPACTALAELVRVAGTRWAVEECFQAAKNETGLDHYQVRRYDACLLTELPEVSSQFSRRGRSGGASLRGHDGSGGSCAASRAADGFAGDDRGCVGAVSAG